MPKQVEPLPDIRAMAQPGVSAIIDRTSPTTGAMAIAGASRSLPVSLIWAITSRAVSRRGIVSALLAFSPFDGAALRAA